MASKVVLPATGYSRSWARTAPIHQSIFGICRVDAVAVFAVVGFEANPCPLVQRLFDAQRVVRSPLGLQIRILKLAAELRQIRKLRILPIGERNFRVWRNGERETASGHPYVLSGQAEVLEPTSPRKCQA